MTESLSEMVLGPTRGELFDFLIRFRLSVEGYVWRWKSGEIEEAPHTERIAGPTQNRMLAHHVRTRLDWYRAMLDRHRQLDAELRRRSSGPLIEPCLSTGPRNRTNYGLRPRDDSRSSQMTYPPVMRPR